VLAGVAVLVFFAVLLSFRGVTGATPWPTVGVEPGDLSFADLTLGHVELGLRTARDLGVSQQSVRSLPSSGELSADLDAGRAPRARSGGHRADRRRDRRHLLSSRRSRPPAR